MTIQFPPADHSTVLKPWLQKNHPEHYASSSIVALLARNSYSLTAIPLLHFSSNFVQISGHPHSLQPASPLTLWKKCNRNELDNYLLLSRSELKNYIPKYESCTEYKGELFIELENLLSRFNDSTCSVMDIKMGRRTWVVEEGLSEGRTDLYQKMIKLDPSAPTDEEHEQKKLTKLRYMQWRETESSTAEFGFRIEGMKIGDNVVNNKNLQLQKSPEDIRQVLNQFLILDSLRVAFVDKLKNLRSALEQSEFFRRHEMIGSSLLVIHNRKELNVWMIDFAKTFESSVALDHRSEWRQGVSEQEDGYLFGLDRLIEISSSGTGTT